MPTVVSQALVLSETAPPAPAPSPRTLPAHAHPQVDDLGPLARRLLAGGVVAVHVIGGWALLQVDAVRQAVVEAAPIMVRMIAPPDAPEPPKPPPPPQARKLPTPVAPAPVIAAAPTPSPAPPVFVAPPPEPMPPVVVATPAPPAPPAPVVAPSLPRQISASEVRYVSPPRLTMPQMSKRLGESGIVVLRIVVDARGQLKSAAVKKSSGFERLDQQALMDIRTARFAPYLENGQAVEWETQAPFAYEVQ